MALGSGVTLRFELAKLPLLPGVEALARAPFLTRASKTNREYVWEELRIDGTTDPAQWWGMYGFDGDSVVAWACMDTLTPAPADWTKRGVTPFMIGPGQMRQFVLVPTNVPPGPRMLSGTSHPSNVQVPRKY